jgi:hypothetical protein
VPLKEMQARDIVLGSGSRWHLVGIGDNSRFTELVVVRAIGGGGSLTTQLT